jgi:hypothetical protein
VPLLDEQCSGNRGINATRHGDDDTHHKAFAPSSP